MTTPFWLMNQISVDAKQTSGFESNNHSFVELLSSNRRHCHSLVGIIVLINSTPVHYTSRMSNQQLIENQSPVESTSNATPAVDDPFSSVQVPDELWTTRLQDKGCSKEMMPAKVYQRAQIPPIGPKGNETY